MKIQIVKTNIVNVSADAVVLPANSSLEEGSGASTAIFEAAGRKMLSEACKKIATCEVGSAVPTLAYNLNAKYIIHAVVPKWIDGTNGEYDLLTSTYLSALNVADVMGCTSIAFPLLASGNNGYDLKLAFQIARESIETFEAINLKKVILVIFGENVASIVKTQGYEVIDIPFSLPKNEQKHKVKEDQIAGVGMGIAQKFLLDQIQVGLNYLKDEKNQEKIFSAAINIAKTAYKIVKKN